MRGPLLIDTVMFFVFDFSGGDAHRRVVPLWLLRVRVRAENELFRCSVFVGRVKHADVDKLYPWYFGR